MVELLEIMDPFSQLRALFAQRVSDLGGRIIEHRTDRVQRETGLRVCHDAAETLEVVRRVGR